MIEFLISFFVFGVLLALLAILAERGFRQTTWVQSAIQGGRDLCLFSMGIMFGLIVANPSFGWTPRIAGYLCMAGAGSLFLILASLRRSKWQAWTIASWSVGLGIVGMSFPILWSGIYETGFHAMVVHLFGLNE